MKGRNDYNKEGKAARQGAREEAGHRCIRCGHPYQCGQTRTDKGEWSDCDEQCTHGGLIRFGDYGAGPPYYPSSWGHYPEDNTRTPKMVMDSAINEAGQKIIVQAKWRILTAHHFDGDKSNDVWWNLMALCQVCHLQIQNKVNPDQPWIFGHSQWIKPYVAGFYARKYLKQELTREEATARLAELLALECITP